MMDNAVSIGPSKDAANFDEFTCPKCGGSKPSCCSCPTPAAPAKPCLDSPLKERARRVVEDTPRGTLDSLELLIERVAAFGDQVRTATTEEAARVARDLAADQRKAHKEEKARLCVDFTDPQLRYMQGAASAAEVIEERIRTLSPDPNYLDRVRNEAATAALEQERTRIQKIVAGKLVDPQHIAGPYDEAWNDAINIVIAAIGDDKEQRQ